MQATSRQPLTERNWSVLGLLRFVLAVSVMMSHIHVAVGYHDWIEIFGGFGPVCGFFLISGFSIAASLASHRKGYYMRRIRRIYPLSIACVFFTVIVIAITQPGPTLTGIIIKMPDSGALVATLFLLNGIVVVTPILLGQLWTLNCEMVFYLVAPLIRDWPTRTISIVALISALMYAALIPVNPLFYYPLAKSGVAIVCLSWVWLLGFLLYRHSDNRRLGLVALAGAGFLISAETVNDGLLSAPFFFVTGIIIAYLPHIALPQKFVNAANYLGELSYPVYILHLSVIIFADWLLKGKPFFLIGGFIIVATMVLAIAAYHGIDRQFRKPRRVRTE